ncbi:uncharacterized protein LOC121937323 [Sceloporus undulatus]|uniref:uncharacterized protein LOC121937323 n=1 Tax=Sceloporus undulatus TaxID=8520 RepID=UPI001C4C0202|nr:uncharacterized protein LOC121937323 [Sceloporus undulatus]
MQLQSQLLKEEVSQLKCALQKSEMEVATLWEELWVTKPLEEDGTRGKIWLRQEIRRPDCCGQRTVSTATRRHRTPTGNASSPDSTCGHASSPPEEPSTLPSEEDQPVPITKDRFQREQRSDPTLQVAWSLARGEAHATWPNKRAKFVVTDGLLYCEFWPKNFKGDWSPQEQLLVPTTYRAKLLSLAHGHPRRHTGVTRTKDRLKKASFWVSKTRQEADSQPETCYTNPTRCTLLNVYILPSLS